MSARSTPASMNGRSQATTRTHSPRRALERREQSADGAKPGHACRDRSRGQGPQIESGCGADHEDFVRDPLQDIHLSNDDGAAEDDEATLVLSAEAAGLAAREDGGRGRRRAHGWIMTEAHIGRLVAACLHQAIVERIAAAARVLRALAGLGRAPRRRHRTGADSRPWSVSCGPKASGYERVVERAGELAALWSIETLTPFRRRSISWLPHALRLRAALRAASSIVRDVSRTSRPRTRVAGAAARLEVSASLFCAVRGQSEVPLCGFYATLVVETLRQFNIGSTSRLETCRGMGAPGLCHPARRVQGRRGASGCCRMRGLSFLMSRGLAAASVVFLLGFCRVPCWPSNRRRRGYW